MDKNKKPKIGLVARCDNSGLGILSNELFSNLDFEKVLVTSSQYENHYDRYDKAKQKIICDRGIPTINEIRQFCEGLDLIIALETPYNWNLFKMAKEKFGVKTALYVMYEWTYPEGEMPFEPDVFLCPTQLDYDEMWGNRVLLPTPTDRKLVPRKKRPLAKEGEPLTFLFNNGHGGYGGRNSLDEFIQATQMVESDVRFLIRSQVPIDDSIRDTRIEFEFGDLPYEKLWTEGDVYVHLHKFDGLSLPIQEAFAAGMPIMALNRPPYNELIDEEMMVDPADKFKVKMPMRSIEACTVNPREVAEKIDQIAKMPRERLIELAEKSNEIAEQFDWKALKPKWEETLYAIATDDTLGLDDNPDSN